ncbi:MAG: hypothetical protein JWN48_3381 [Myxococcaceae bacterium]|nr:hypothetical protein [Myxococcaceae bacterium]
MMAVRFTRSLVPVWLGLALALVGCEGSVLVGTARDAGDEGYEDPPGTVSDAGAASSDARTAQPDASGASKDAGPATVTPTADAGKPSTSDAGAPPTPTPDAAVMPSGRDFSTDKTKFLGAARCPGDVLLCDDFEAPAVGGPPGSNWTYPFSFTPQIDTGHVARGSKAMLLAITGGTPSLIELAKPIFPLANNTIFGRMFVWIEDLPSGPNYAHFTMVGASSSTSSNKAEVRIDAQLETDPSRGHVYYGVGSDGGDSGDWHTPGTEVQSIAVAKTWTCLEWQFKGDTSETRVWIDGIEQASLHTTSTEYRPGDAEMGKVFTHPPFDTLRIGYWIYQTTTPPTANVWIDEVIVDKARIGCVL